MTTIGVSGTYDQIGANPDTITWPVVAETDGNGNIVRLIANGVEVVTSASLAFASITGNPADNAALDAVIDNLQSQIDGIGGVSDGDKSGVVVTGSGAVWTPKVGMRFTFDTSSTADSDPGSGRMKVNNATQPSMTSIFIDVNEIGGIDISNRVKMLTQGTILRIEQESNPAKWHEVLLMGVVAAAGYYKLTVTPIVSGTAIDDEATVRLSVCGTAQGYMGTLAGDITAMTLNGDNSVATITINGLTWTLAYNSNGSLGTETIALAGDDLVRTYNYNASGTFTGVSGTLDKNGHLHMTWAQAKDLKTVIQSGSTSVAAVGTKIFVTDLGSITDAGGTKVPGAAGHWVSTGATTGYWDFPGGVPYIDYTDSAVFTGSAATSGTLKTLTIPAGLMGPYGKVELTYADDYGTADLGAKTPNCNFNGTLVHRGTATAAGTRSTTRRQRFFNRGSVSSQMWFSATAGSSSLGDASAAMTTSAVNTDSTDGVLTRTITLANAGDSAKVQYFNATVYPSGNI